MNLKVLCVGRRAKDPLLDSADEYFERLKRYARAELVRVRDGSPSEERDRLLARLPEAGPIVALDERGQTVATSDVAKRFEFWQQHAQSPTFVIGGACGLASDVKQRATMTWSLSALTLPHRLALVVLLEQLYRAHTILRGEKYHRP